MAAEAEGVQPMGKVLSKVKEELVAMLPPTLFFFFTLGLIAVIRALMLRGTGVPVSSAAQIAIGALILGKAVLVADMLPAINRYPDKPLAYNVAWKTAIYLVIASLIHYAERLADFWKEADGFVAANEKLLAQVIWPHFWAVQLVLVVLIFDYCVIRELARILGRRKLLEMFFGAPASQRRGDSVD
jgi:hypothetical protein